MTYFDRELNRILSEDVGDVDEYAGLDDEDEFDEDEWAAQPTRHVDVRDVSLGGTYARLEWYQTGDTIDCLVDIPGHRNGIPIESLRTVDNYDLITKLYTGLYSDETIPTKWQKPVGAQHKWMQEMIGKLREDIAMLEPIVASGIESIGDLNRVGNAATARNRSDRVFGIILSAYALTDLMPGYPFPVNLSSNTAPLIKAALGCMQRAVQHLENNDTNFIKLMMIYRMTDEISLWCISDDSQWP